MNNSSETNWEQADQQTDDTIDTSDIPLLTDSFFSRAKLRTPQKLVEATIRMDEEILEWFKAQGDHMNNLATPHCDSTLRSTRHIEVDLAST